MNDNSDLLKELSANHIQDAVESDFQKLHFDVEDSSDSDSNTDTPTLTDQKTNVRNPETCGDNEAELKSSESIPPTGGLSSNCCVDKLIEETFKDSVDHLSDTSSVSSDDDDKTGYESADEGDDDIEFDEENLKKIEEELSDEAKEERKKMAHEERELGNSLFREKKYEDAQKYYTKGLQICPLAFSKDRAIMYSNRAACKMKMEKHDKAILDSSKAIELHPTYIKAILRRAELYEKVEKLDEALTDYQKVVELDPSQHGARAACMRLPDEIKERNEKLKEEMLGKLKDLGNMILKPFGLSTNNFQMQQDPNSGSYSVKFNQNGN